MHIAIAGNIGSGKTTLTKMLAKRYGWKANFEPVDNNPFLLIIIRIWKDGHLIFRSIS